VEIIALSLCHLCTDRISLTAETVSTLITRSGMPRTKSREESCEKLEDEDEESKILENIQEFPSFSDGFFLSQLPLNSSEKNTLHFGCSQSNGKFVHKNLH
jgi:hypothetical protein